VRFVTPTRVAGCSFLMRKSVQDESEVTRLGGGTMRLKRSEVVEGLSAELGEFVALVADLRPEQWNAPTRCAGWTVADVTAHVAGNLDVIVTGRLEEFTRP